MTETTVVENKNHTIIGTVTRITLLCGECGKSWEEMGGGHWYRCPHCDKGLPAWGLPQNIRFDLGAPGDLTIRDPAPDAARGYDGNCRTFSIKR